MNPTPLISICIPAYKNVNYLKRLLDSVSVQTFKNYEVIITDDSPDDSVQSFVMHYSGISDLHYHRNTVALGTPENWNEAIRRSNGIWVKLMHDDDWFASPQSLESFILAANGHSDCAFIYSSYRNVNLVTNETKQIHPSYFRQILLKKDPYTLSSKNIIGPPSAVMYKKDETLTYDMNLKWLVDIDFYVRYLHKYKAAHVKLNLVNIGLGELQVTRYSSLVKEVEVPEYFNFFAKTDFASLNNILVYDAWWRLLRNLDIKDINEIRTSGYAGPIPLAIRSMMSFQKKFNRGLLKIGAVSKLLMTFHFIFNRRHRN
jgi:glycosyltransferase involved in cell wall biosynthesis